mmetsp:Transcript_37117/g.97291  ORF Transcript_37117/g.97291 Transcript_37117/m.97291 type:complete len:230 (+) Transcript_37117:333-1022(+)
MASNPTKASTEDTIDSTALARCISTARAMPSASVSARLVSSSTMGAHAAVTKSGLVTSAHMPWPHFARASLLRWFDTHCTSAAWSHSNAGLAAPRAFHAMPSSPTSPCSRAFRFTQPSSSPTAPVASAVGGRSSSCPCSTAHARTPTPDGYTTRRTLCIKSRTVDTDPRVTLSSMGPPASTAAASPSSKPRTCLRAASSCPSHQPRHFSSARACLLAAASAEPGIVPSL